MLRVVIMNSFFFKNYFQHKLWLLVVYSLFCLFFTCRTSYSRTTFVGFELRKARRGERGSRRVRMLLLFTLLAFGFVLSLVCGCKLTSFSPHAAGYFSVWQCVQRRLCAFRKNTFFFYNIVLIKGTGMLSIMTLWWYEVKTNRI